MKVQNDYFHRLHRLIYFSRATPQTLFDMGTVFPAILQAAVRKNAEVEISGALLECGGWFLQALEGPRINVTRVYERIGSDRRHQAIHLIKAEPVDERKFANWHMCGRCLSPTDKQIVELLEGRNAFSPHKLTPASALNLLGVVREIQIAAQQRPESIGQSNAAEGPDVWAI